MPGLDSTLLNQTYSTPLRLVHVFLHVTEQVWQPIHLSRLKMNANCARTFMSFSYLSYFTRRSALADSNRVALSFPFRGKRRLQPLDILLLNLVHDDLGIAVASHRAIVIKAVGQLDRKSVVQGKSVD